MTTTPNEQSSREREAFEKDAEPMGFDLTRFECAAPEPWSEYADSDTGHRWGGWLARSTLSGQTAESGEAVARAYVAGNDMVRELHWMPDQPSFDLPVGTKLYASALPAQAVAYLVSGLPSGEPSLCFEDERGDYGGDDHTPVFEPLVRAAQPVAQPGKVPTPRYAREMEAVGQAVNRAARDLLGDARIRIDLEGGAGTVYWLDKKKGAWRHIDTGDLFSEQINAAVDAAMKE